MLSKEGFCKALQMIKEQESIDEQFSKALNLVGDGHFVFGAENKYLMALRDVLKEAVNDQYDYIDWWLYEATDDYTVWEADCTMKYSYYEWDEYDDWYRVYNLIVDRVDTMLGYFCRWAEYAIKDANPDETCPTADYVRLLVYRC